MTSNQKRTIGGWITEIREKDVTGEFYGGIEVRMSLRAPFEPTKPRSKPEDVAEEDRDWWRKKWEEYEEELKKYNDTIRALKRLHLGYAELVQEEGEE